MDASKKQKLSEETPFTKTTLKKEDIKVSFNQNGVGIKKEEPNSAPLPKHVGLYYEENEDDKPVSKLALNFLQQKFHFYSSRCEALRDNLLRQSKEVWGDFVLGPPVVELDEGIRAHLIGNIRAELTNKPNIIFETKTNFDISKPAEVEKYYDGNDKYYISDPFGSIQIGGELLKEVVFFTGVVVGIRGTVKNGCLEVDSIVFPKIRPHKVLSPCLDGKPKYIGFVSGLKLNENNPKVHDLKSFLMQKRTNELDIVKLIIAGGTLDYKQSDSEKDSDNWNKYRKKILKTDNFLSELGMCLKVAALPGGNDPTDLIPSKQFSQVLFRKTRMIPGVTFPCNPYAAKIEDLTMVGDTGRIVEDMCKYGDIGPLEALQWTIKYNLLAPNLYDTVSCQPLQEDPYIMQDLPHLIFTSNCNKFETQLVDINGQKVRLLALPKFQEQPKLVLVDIHTLRCETVTF